jgi:AcrR family transcriptional regulator
MNESSAAPSTMPRPIKGRPRGFDRNEALAQALDVFWQRGYEPASIVELCTAMGINPPSLYAAFGNKATLFLEAVNFYDRKYWDAARVAMGQEPDVYRGIASFFKEAAAILLSPLAPCGCLVVLAAINVSPDSTEVYEAVRSMPRWQDFLRPATPARCGGRPASQEHRHRLPCFNAQGHAGRDVHSSARRTRASRAGRYCSECGQTDARAVD